jgi:hypothetical protein
LVEGKIYTPRKKAAGFPQGSVLAPILYSLYTNDAPATPESHIALLEDDTCIYATDKKECRDLQTAARPHCSKVVVRALEHKDQ